jgi:ATP-dependent DNA helicase 2 subunit 1
MQELRDDPVYERAQISNLLGALDATLRIYKRKVIVGPKDSLGILLFNTVRKIIIEPPTLLQFVTQSRTNDGSDHGSEMKPNTFLLQPIETINAPRIKEIIHILEGISISQLLQPGI